MTHNPRGRSTIAMMYALFVLPGLIATMLTATPASATPIRYTITGVASGSLGLTQFDARTFTVWLQTDTDSVSTWQTDGISSYAFFGPLLPETSASIEIEGLPVAVFTTTVELFLAQAYTPYYGNPLLAFGRPNSQESLPGWAFMVAQGLANANLATPFGTALSAGSTCGSNSANQLNTNRGALIRTNCGSYLTSITAQLVPIPAAGWLFGTALGLMGVMHRRSARR